MAWCNDGQRGCPYRENVEWFGDACHHPVIYKKYPLRQKCSAVLARDECHWYDVEAEVLEDMGLEG